MKKIILTLAAFSLVSFGFAQEFDFGGSDDFGGDDFGGGFEESAEPSVKITGEVGADVRGWVGTGAKDPEDANITHDTRGYDGIYDVSKSDVEGSAYANLELNYAGEYTDANLKLKLDSATLKDHPEDVVDEVYASGSFKDGVFQLKAGKMKEVWGKGDKIHVLDNFNANDYTDFIFPDYIDRRLGEVMFKATANLSWDYNMKLEGIYTPWMTADRFAASGKFSPYKQRNITSNVTAKATTGLSEYITTLEEARALAAEVSTLNSIMTAAGTDADKTAAYTALSSKVTEAAKAGLITTNTTEIETYMSANTGVTQEAAKERILAGKYAAYVKANLSTAVTNYTIALSNASALSSNADDLYPDTHTLRYGQAGVRLTGTLAGIDWGTSYYYGHYKQPSFNAGKLTTYIQKYLADEDIEEDDKFLQYDQLQVFGLEAAFVVWKLNTRWELAYNMTEDFEGTNQAIHNHSIAWVAGFDIDLPIHNLNLNVQETGSYILHNKDIIEGNAYDVDYNSDDKYTKNKLIVLLSDKWLNEKLTTEVQGIWGIECKEFVVVPKISYNVTEGLTFTAKGAYIYSDNTNGEFYNFTADSKHHDKAFVQLSAKYQF